MRKTTWNMRDFIANANVQDSRSVGSPQPLNLNCLKTKNVFFQNKTIKSTFVLKKLRPALLVASAGFVIFEFKARRTRRYSAYDHDRGHILSNAEHDRTQITTHVGKLPSSPSHAHVDAVVTNRDKL
jgi:hypothetical protein